MAKRAIIARITEDEDKVLVSYAESRGETKTSVIRQLIRSLVNVQTRDSTIDRDAA